MTSSQMILKVQAMCVLLGCQLHVFVHPCLWLGVKEDLITRLLTYYESVSVERDKVLCHIYGVGV